MSFAVFVLIWQASYYQPFHLVSISGISDKLLYLFYSSYYLFYPCAVGISQYYVFFWSLTVEMYYGKMYIYKKVIFSLSW